MCKEFKTVEYTEDDGEG